jgi:hypothetical protein
MSEQLEEAVRSICERNQRERAKTDQQSARLASILVAENWTELDDFNRELADGFHGLLEGAVEDPTIGGTDSGSGDGGNSSGESPQQ